MGTRTTRIPSNKLEQKKDGLVGKLVQVVFWEGSTKTGRVESANATSITVRDPNTVWYNRKRHTHDIELSAIREVLLDEVSEW